MNIKYIRSEKKILATANELNTLMKAVPNYAERLFQVRNSNSLNFGKWEVFQNGSSCRILVKDMSEQYEDVIRFYIDEVDHILS